MKPDTRGHFDRLEHIIKTSTSRAASEREVLVEIMRSHGALFSSHALDPDALYRAIAFRHNGPLLALINECFTVLARPGEAPVASPQPGDVLVRVGLPGLGHVAVLADATLWPAARLAHAPFSAESQRPGFYALVIEPGACPHTRADLFARCILDAAGRTTTDQIILRPTSSIGVSTLSSSLTSESPLLHPSPVAFEEEIIGKDECMLVPDTLMVQPKDSSAEAKESFDDFVEDEGQAEDESQADDFIDTPDQLSESSLSNEHEWENLELKADVFSTEDFNYKLDASGQWESVEPYEAELSDFEDELLLESDESESGDLLPEEEEETAKELSKKLTEPAKTKREEVRDRPHIVVIDDQDKPVTDGEYAFHQGELSERGQFSKEREGSAYFSKIDPAQPFVFEVRDRVCAIRAGAFFNPDDPKIEYGGTWFDWTLVRDDKNAEKNFWPYYKQEMDFAVRAESYETTLGRRIDRFLQHEHITRRPIQVAKPFLTQLSKVRIRATPARLRVGPFVRCTDHECAVIWLETVTPTMVRMRYKQAGGGTESSRYTSTVRIGGRHFAAVEVDGLAEDRFHEYTVELAPLPATGAIPIAQKEFEGVFPQLTSPVATSMKKQFATASLNQTEWLTFRTLRRKYDKQLRFATGSCRWYPGDKKDGKDWGPDMLHGLGDWLRTTPKEKWPHFLFFGGDQIYSDEIGDDHGEMLIRGRFAARIPGPVDPRGSVRDKLIDGAWAGRFAHRYQAYKDPDMGFVERVRAGLKKLDEIHRLSPDIKGIYREYPDKDPRNQLRERYTTLKGRREITGAKGEAPDEKKAREAVALLPTVDNLEISSEPFRGFLPHWEAGFSTALRRNPMGSRYLSHNFLLWSLPDFEPQLPTVADQGGFTIARKPDQHGHPGAEGGRHAADFAEYAYFYERAWTSSRSVRVLLAQVPTFLMFDDHEVTDDWNFDVSWMRMLHNEKDAYRMWPKTLTDALAAYWVYQGWGNKAPSQWNSKDPRVVALAEARRQGIDALPELRKCIHRACFMPEPPQEPKNPREPKPTFQMGLSLDWHYKLPFDPPFLVPDCRTRKFMVPADDELRIINHDDPKQRPMSQTIDNKQLAWMRKILIEEWRGGPVAFIAPSTPLLLQQRVMDIMMKPETVARAWAQGADVVSGIAAIADSTKLGFGSNKLLRVFRRVRDLEHMIRDRSWRDLWELVEGMRAKGSSVKTLVLVSGDVHHNYCMTANLPGSGRPKPEMLQITCSGLQTTIRSSKSKWLAEQLGNSSFDLGKYRLVPGFMSKNGTGSPDLALFENAVALVDVRMGPEVDVVVTYLAGKDNKEPAKHVYRYTSGAAYMKGREPAIMQWRATEAEAGMPFLTEPDLDEAELDPFYSEMLDSHEEDEFTEEKTVGFVDEPSLERDFHEPLVEPARSAQPGLFAAEQSSLERGQSITIDGQNVRTYVDAIAWYTTRGDILREQKQAFVKDGYLVPNGLDDLAFAADARVKMMRKLGSQPVSDSHVEGTLGWLDAYLKVMYECDLKMEVIAADRFRATRAEVEKLKEQMARLLLPQLRDAQRSAFRNGNESKLKQSAETFATWLDSTLVAEQWVRDAVTQFDDIRVLGTTLRTQKALHGSSQPWHELMRQTTNAKISKLLSVAKGLNKTLAVWQLFDASLALLSGGKTSSDRASAGIAFTATAASAGGTLLGASGFFSLYNNLYIGPMVKRILSQINQLKDRISIGRNRPFIQLGHLDQVNWSIEPGGREMYEFIRGVMRARSATDIGAIPTAVSKYFSKHQSAFDAGTPRRHDIDINYADIADKRHWVFSFRDDIWGMLYGSMPVA